MDSNLIKYQAFVKAVDAGSLTKAAEALGYSQPGVSRMIRDLEASWGLTLLERGHASLRTTSAGEMLLPLARRLCEDFEALCATASEISGLHTGMIRIGVFSSVATHWTPGVIQAFQKDFPGVDYELLMGDYTEIENWIAEGRVDFGFVCLPVRRDLETIFLERDPFFAILPEKHPLSALEKVPLSLLCRETFLTPEKGERKTITELFQNYGLSIHTHFTTWDDYAILSMVENGLGVNVLPGLILKRNPYRVAVRELDVPAFREIGVAMCGRKELSPAARAFLAYLPRRHAAPPSLTPARE